MKKNPTIGIAFITHNAAHHLPQCLPPMLKSPLNPRVLVVNSSSTDDTVKVAKELGADTLVIPRQTFNHGATRELARQHLKTDIVVMMTPDAYAVDEHVLQRLTKPLIERKSSVAYARQIPHKNAGFFESFAREFNYPQEGHIRSIKDISRYGVYTFFCSDSCAAYSNTALEEIGGFTPVLIGEDTVAVAKLLHKGHLVAYVAEALVHHSHSYSLWQEFQRHFDTGLARKSYGNLLYAAGKDSARGKLYMRALFRKLHQEAPFLVPYAVLQTATKWTGYQLGRYSNAAPHWWKKLLSGQDFYWTKKV